MLLLEPRESGTFEEFGDGVGTFREIDAAAPEGAAHLLAHGGCDEQMGLLHE